MKAGKETQKHSKRQEKTVNDFVMTPAVLPKTGHFCLTYLRVHGGFPLPAEISHPLQRLDAHFELAAAMAAEVGDVVPAAERLQAAQQRGQIDRGEADHLLRVGGAFVPDFEHQALLRVKKEPLGQPDEFNTKASLKQPAVEVFSHHFWGGGNGTRLQSRQWSHTGQFVSATTAVDTGSAESAAAYET